MVRAGVANRAVAMLAAMPVVALPVGVRVGVVAVAAVVAEPVPRRHKQTKNRGRVNLPRFFFVCGSLPQV